MTFRSSHQAARAERACHASGLPARLVPGPKDLSPDCGVALAVRATDRAAVEEVLLRNRVEFRAVHPYAVPKRSWLHRILPGFGERPERRIPDGE